MAETSQKPRHKTRFWYLLGASQGGGGGGGGILSQFPMITPCHFCMGVPRDVNAERRLLHNALSDEVLFVFYLDTAGNMISIYM